MHLQSHVWQSIWIKWIKMNLSFLPLRSSPLLSISAQMTSFHWTNIYHEPTVSRHCSRLWDAPLNQTRSLSMRLHSRGFQVRKCSLVPPKMWSTQLTPASPRSLTKMQILKHNLRPTEAESLGEGPAICACQALQGSQLRSRSWKCCSSQLPVVPL